jgi:uncharacterized protein YbjT (DUF2867 family)
MADTQYVVFGATGHVGNIAATRLLEAGRKVRVVGRDAAKLEPLTRRGAEAATGSIDDPAFLARAFAGAQATFLLLPPDPARRGFRAWQTATAEALGTAIEKSGLTHVVTLSSVGAHLPSGNGPIAGLHTLEQRLDRIAGRNVLHLRPGFFFENLFMAIPMVKNMGMNGGAIAPDLRFPMIATRDIGETAARRLVELDFRGRNVLELHGQRDLSMTEATTAIGRAIGKPDLRYVQFPYEPALQGMVQMGLPEELAGLYVEMARGFNEGHVQPAQPRSAATTTPTSIEWFADNVFAPAWKAA